MASYRRMFQFLLGFVGCTLLVMLFFYLQDMSQRTLETMHQRQKMRKQMLKEMCDRNISTFYEGKRSFDELQHDDLGQLIVDDKHGIIYCFIPKVACTNWKRVMSVLNKPKPYPDPMSISHDMVHTHRDLTFLNTFPRTEIKAKLKLYTKFLFVRDPFVRVISAYRDKVEEPKVYFYDYFSREILQRYGNKSNPPETVKEALALGVHPSFHNFIQFLIDSRTSNWARNEPHWRQMYRLCHPCLIDYDFIGHQETLQEDAVQLLKILRLQDDITFPPAHENMTSPDSLLDWFSSVPLEERQRLYKRYESDFSLFGYRRPDDLLDG